jgi:hypothetical protein
MAGVDAKFLPETGRGTMRSMVEGHPRVLMTSQIRICPSTTLRVVPLPVPGRN